MGTPLVGFFLDAPTANDAIAQLKAAGLEGITREGEQFDSKWQQGRIAVLVDSPGAEADEAEVRAVLLRAGALDVQGGAVKSDSDLATETMKAAQATKTAEALKKVAETLKEGTHSETG